MSGVKAKAPPVPASSASQPKTPLAQVKTLFDWQVVRLKPLIEVPQRLVDEALVVKRLVVVALVPVALPKEREPADTNGPENVELEMEALVKVPPSVMPESMADKLPTSELL